MPSRPRVFHAVTAAAVAVAVVVVPSAAAQAAATTLQQQLNSAAAYGAAQGMRTGVAVFDTRTGRIYGAGDSYGSFTAASVAKALIAARLLLTHQMRGANETLAWSMITQSDNNAADALYPLAGGDSMLRDLQAHYRLPRVGAPAVEPGFWGTTQLTPRGLARLYNAFRHDHTVWPWLSKAMHAHKEYSSAGEFNGFGLAAVAPRSAVKNGWLAYDGPNSTRAVVNTTGYLTGDRYAIVVLSDGAPSLYYAPGERIVTAVTSRAVRALATAPPAASIQPVRPLLYSRSASYVE